MPNRLAALTLNVTNPDTLAEFYCRILGMRRFERDGCIAVGYGNEGAVLVLKPVDDRAPYQHSNTDRYWKIGLTLPDIDCANARLKAHGISASEPHQFRDIGYLSHFADPEGHIIELVQHTFEGETKITTGDPALPLGGGAEIGLVTLRTDNIEKEIDRCEATLGLKSLVRERISDLGFDLYFLGRPGDTPPDPDPDALINRPWLYQRSYTVLEFQHIKRKTEILAPMPGQKGYSGITVERTGTDKENFV
ncbi:VOC family protein [Labrenzia sp. PHM005]|uniref:VOC family protein n=1 Tax=Labrenzia sp. PHM005 TaxID=2590016 RepID=UPI001140374A|nr:VOC family protein [Labrenzia sp. PHM005]QDG74738.1 VOC family protein [Labrenzia sp. PHM005]